MNMKTSENELDILNIFRKLDDAENNIREEKVFEAQTSLAVLRNMVYNCKFHTQKPRRSLQAARFSFRRRFP